MNTEKKTKKTFFLVGGMFLLLFIIGAVIIYFNGGIRFNDNSTFSQCLGFEEKAGWTVLARPNSNWGVGQAIEFTNNSNTPNLLGNFIEDCLLELPVQSTTGVAAATSCDNSLNYSLNLNAAFGLSDEVLSSLGFNLGSDETSPLKTSVRIKSAKETSLNILQIENYLTKEKYDSMLLGCKFVLTDPNRFIIAGTYQIEEGIIEIKKDNDIEVDLNLPEFEELKKAIAKSGFGVSSSGKIEISKQTPPLIVAVRGIDFSKILEKLGIGARGSGKDFETRMKEKNLSIEE